MKNLFISFLFSLFILICSFANSQVYVFNVFIEFDSTTFSTSVTYESSDSFEVFTNKGRCSMELRLKLKDSLPDGEYQISYNDTLNYMAFYKKQVKHGVWIYFNSSGVGIRKEKWVFGVLKD